MTSWLDNAWKDVETEIDGLGVFLGGAFKGLLKTEVTALRPIVTTLVQTADTDIVTAASTGSLSSIGSVFGTLVNQTIAEAEKTGIIAGIGSIGTTVANALAAHPAVATLTTSAGGVPVIAEPNPAPEPTPVAEPAAPVAGLGAATSAE